MVLESVDSKFYYLVSLYMMKKYSFYTLKKLKMLKGNLPWKVFWQSCLLNIIHSLAKVPFLGLICVVDFPGSSAHKESACNAGGSIPGLKIC